MREVQNPYAPPRMEFDEPASGENTSGMGKGHPIPDGVKGWSWGAFLLNWIWSIGNRTWFGLFSMLPYVGIGFMIWLGLRGRELAWQNKKWHSVKHFNEVQRRWSVWGLVLVVGVFGVGFLSSLGIYGVRRYIELHRH